MTLATLPAAPPAQAEEASAPEPSALRLLLVFGAATALVAGAFLLAGALAPAAATPGGLAGSLALGALAMLLVGALGEWAVHRWTMHRPSRLPVLRLAFQLHHRAHHWVQFPPDEYVHEGPVQYPPVWPARTDRVGTSRAARALTIAAHSSFYALFALGLAVVPGWLVSGNPPFVLALGATATLLIYLFVHVHDAVHYPGHSPLERFGWFWWLDEHHYLHHVDNRANTNFLLPLGDLLLGTQRRRLRADELARWPSYPEARARRVRPEFDPQGARVRVAPKGVVPAARKRVPLPVSGADTPP
jgi:sterol desaturase/sphingolipid hydroxylase (fatty acid hydroxylase superfamily)